MTGATNLIFTGIRLAFFAVFGLRADLAIGATERIAGILDAFAFQAGFALGATLVFHAFTIIDAVPGNSAAGLTAGAFFILAFQNADILADDACEAARAFRIDAGIVAFAIVADLARIGAGRLIVDLAVAVVVEAVADFLGLFILAEAAFVNQAFIDLAVAVVVEAVAFFL